MSAPFRYPRRVIKKSLESFQQVLAEEQCRWSTDTDAGVIDFYIQGRHGRWRCVAMEDDDGRFSCLSLLPLTAPKSRRRACAELVARLNFALPIGSFDFDCDDGELRFHTSHHLAPGSELPPETSRHLLGAHHTVVDAAIPALAAVLFVGMKPEKAMNLDPARPAENPEPRFRLN